MTSICMHLTIARWHSLEVTLNLNVLVAMATGVTQVPYLTNSNLLHFCYLAISELYLVFSLIIYCTFQVF